jgi:hypothetical protein
LTAANPIKSTHQAIYRCPEAVKACRASDIEKLPLWVVTRGAYVGRIIPAQGTVQGWMGVLANEMTEVTAKTVDLASLDEMDLAALARLVLADAPERSYAIEAGAARVPRYHAIDKCVRLGLVCSAFFA